ncbi:MAG: hypothetical protein QF645_07055, partial [Planctomycetota bacterium]|nr:hypothetical protein [Planctomycetota bacterium]
MTRGLHAPPDLTELNHQHKGKDNFLMKLDTDEFLAYTLPFQMCAEDPLHRAALEVYIKRKKKG